MLLENGIDCVSLLANLLVNKPTVNWQQCSSSDEALNWLLVWANTYTPQTTRLVWPLASLVLNNHLYHVPYVTELTIPCIVRFANFWFIPPGPLCETTSRSQWIASNQLANLNFVLFFQNVALNSNQI